MNNTTQILEYGNLNMKTILYCSVLGIFLIWYLKYHWSRRKLYRSARKIPGPRTLPFIGNAHLIAGDASDNLNKAVELVKQFSGLVKLWFGPQLVVAFDRPEYIKKIVNHPHAMSKPYFYFILKDAINEGLITSKAEKWRRHRKIISPSFNQNILNLFVDVFHEKTMIFVNDLKNYTCRKDLDMYNLAIRCTLDMICQTIMGIDLDIQKFHCSFGSTIKEMLELLNYRCFRIWYHPDFLWNLSSKSQRLTKVISDFHNVTANVVRKKFKEAIQVGNEAENDSEIKSRMAFLDMIIESGLFTEDEIQEEVDTILVAGTETTAGTFCMICVVLALFPDIQQKVYEEVIHVTGIEGKIVPDHLKALKYTERVIKEVMRVLPTVPMVGRAISSDINMGDFVLPAGCMVMFGVFNLHRNPKYWPDPLKFDPDRFLPEEVAKRHPCSYIPFSFGIRDCIGSRYAMMNLKTMLATVIRHFTFHTEYKSIQEIKLEMSVVLRMTDGLKLSIESRV